MVILISRFAEDSLKAAGRLEKGIDKKLLKKS